MKFNSKELISDLDIRTRKVIAEVEEFKTFPNENLNYREENSSWSALECLEHLNLYGDYYIPEITARIKETNSDFVSVFKSGVLGNYFAKSMLPSEKGVKKMKTFKDKNPLGSNLNMDTIERFINQQKNMLQLLEKANNVNLNKVKTSVSISKLIHLKLGDTLRFVIYHNERHIIQAKRALNINK